MMTLNYSNENLRTLFEPQKCKYLKYDCKETLLSGLIRDDEDLNDGLFTNISHRIRTLFCHNAKK